VERLAEEKKKRAKKTSMRGRKRKAQEVESESEDNSSMQVVIMNSRQRFLIALSWNSVSNIDYQDFIRRYATFAVMSPSTLTVRGDIARRQKRGDFIMRFQLLGDGLT
jgi:hypothetical protein